MAGLFEGLDLPRRMQNPLVQAGAQMMANSGPSLQPKGLFEGVPQAIGRAIEMKKEQDRLDAEEKAKTEFYAMMDQLSPQDAALMRAADVGPQDAFKYVMGQREQDASRARQDAQRAEDRQWLLEDRDYAARRPDMISYEMPNGDILRGNRNDPNGQLSVWYDGPDPAPKAPNIETFFDEATGLDFKGYYDPATGQVVRVGGSGVKAPTNGLSITTADGTVIQQGGTPGKYGQTVDTGFGQMQNELQQGAMSTLNGLNTIDRMEQAMSDPSFYSGAGSEQVMQAKQLAAAMGFDPEGVKSMEDFRALSAQSVMDMMGGSLGAGVSNADRSFVEAQAPRLENTPEGNRSLLEIQRRLYQRQLELAQRAAAYEQQHGKLDARFVQETTAWAHENPLFVSNGGGGALTEMSDQDLLNQLGL
ncbi:MAG: hypothetical protein KIS86_02665 [Devosia sp.]|nr:hypothetical protein [Devosia sp.]